MLPLLPSSRSWSRTDDVAPITLIPHAMLREMVQLATMMVKAPDEDDEEGDDEDGEEE